MISCDAPSSALHQSVAGNSVADIVVWPVKKVRRVTRCITNRRQLHGLRLADRLPDRVLHAADGILNLALGLLSFSFRFRLFVPQKLACGFLIPP